MKDHIIAGKANKQLQNELIELKSLVREFMKSIEYVPLRAVDCNQEIVYNLWNKLIDATGATNDRLGID